MRIRKYKKKIDTKYVVLIFILAVFMIIGILSLIVKDDRKLSFAEKGIKDVGLGIQKVLYMPLRFVIDKIDKYNDMKRIYQKYKDYDVKESEVKMYETENIELKKNLEELKQMLDLNKLLVDYQSINATVINRNIGNWYNTITIDKGEKSGIKVNMIAVTNAGLIGKVIKTTYYSSDIKLVTSSDLNIKISVGIVSSKTTYGLLSGYDRLNRKLLVVDIIDKEDIKEGDKVVTSGLSDAYPKGIIVGTVSKISNDEFGISSVIQVTPAVDFDNIRYVSILKEKDK